MIIEKDKVVTLHYKVTEEGHDSTIEDSQKHEPLVYLHGHQSMLPALEEALSGRQDNEQFGLTLLPEQAYGARKKLPPQRISIKKVLNPGKYKPGGVVVYDLGKGTREGTIVKVGKFNLDIDTNHPLAGKTLIFDIEIQAVRDATANEIAHGHVHGAGGHHH